MDGDLPASATAPPSTKASSLHAVLAERGDELAVAYLEAVEGRHHVKQAMQAKRMGRPSES
jgi:hypothetical protein